GDASRRDLGGCGHELRVTRPGNLHARRRAPWYIGVSYPDRRPMDRRHFVMSSAALAGTALRTARASANDTVRIACVGLRGRGGNHLDGYSALPNVEIGALCDVDSNVLDKRVKQLESK